MMPSIHHFLLILLLCFQSRVYYCLSRQLGSLFDAETDLGSGESKHYKSLFTRRLCNVYQQEQEGASQSSSSSSSSSGSSSKKCIAAEYELEKITAVALADLLDPQMEKGSKGLLDYFTTFTAIRSPSYTHMNIESLHKEIDVFLAPRPWFTYVFRHNCHIFQRISMAMYPFYDSFQKRSFMPQSACDKKFMTVSNHVDDTWGNRIINIHSEFMHQTSFVYHIYTSRAFQYGGRDNEGAAFVNKEACPDEVNKWYCLFLPMSNCSFPEELKNCHESKCFPMPWTHGVYTQAGPAGHLIDAKDYSLYQKKWDILESAGTQNQFTYPARAAVNHKVTTYRSKNSLLNTELASSIKRVIDTPYEDMVAFVFGLAFRMNAKFRSHVEEAVNIFRDNSHSYFDENEKCIAIHIRKNDRTIPGVDMVEWCKNCTILDDKKRKIVDPDPKCSKQDPAVDYPRWMDMGCQADAPYGAVTFEHYLNASLVINPNNRHLFVMTDDPAQLEIDRQRYREKHKKAGGHDGNQIHIHTLSAKPTHRENDPPQAYGSTIDYFASIEIARRCEGFVAHFGSAASRMVSMSLCFQHRDKFHECPVFYDVGGVDG